MSETSEGIGSNRPKGAGICLYRSMLTFFDDDGVITQLDPEYVERLKQLNTASREAMDSEILSEIMHWVIQDTKTGDLAYVLGKWLTKNFDIKLKTA